MNDQTTAENWLILTIGGVFALAGLSLVYDKVQRYSGLGQYSQSFGTTQIQIGADDTDKVLYAGHVLTAGMGDCGCPSCCKG